MLRADERPEERRILQDHLARGRSILQLGPRRVGKTWLINRLAEDLRATWIVVEFSVEGMSAEAEFFEALCRSIEAGSRLSRKILGRASQVLDNVTSRPVTQWAQVAQMDWRAYAGVLVGTVATKPRDSVIIIDEIALFVLALQQRDARAAGEFLYQLRALRQAHPKVRWLLTGSVGLDTVARRTDVAGALMGLEIIPLEPFDATAAASYLAHVCGTGEVRRPFSLDAAGFDHLAAQLGWLSAYYLLRIAERVQPTGAQNPAEAHPRACIADLDAAFDALLQPEFRTYFAPWPEHLTKNFPPDETAQLRAILDCCAARAEGELLDTLLSLFEGAPHQLTRPKLRDRLDALLVDGMLLETDAEDRPRFRFRSGLLRRYWLRYEAA